MKYDWWRYIHGMISLRRKWAQKNIWTWTLIQSIRKCIWKKVSWMHITSISPFQKSPFSWPPEKWLSLLQDFHPHQNRCQVYLWNRKNLECCNIPVGITFTLLSWEYMVQRTGEESLLFFLCKYILFPNIHSETCIRVSKDPLYNKKCSAGIHWSPFWVNQKCCMIYNLQ